MPSPQVLGPQRCTPQHTWGVVAGALEGEGRGGGPEGGWPPLGGRRTSTGGGLAGEGDGGGRAGGVRPGAAHPRGRRFGRNAPLTWAAVGRGRRHKKKCKKTKINEKKHKKRRKLHVKSCQELPRDVQSLRERDLEKSVAPLGKMFHFYKNMHFVYQKLQK